MADAHLTSPLLNHSLSDSPELLIAIDEDSQSPHCDSNQNPKRLMDCPKPYQFLGIREPFVVGQTTLDPFRNETPTVDGFYEVLKIVLCLPIALLRLVLFGVSLGIGYVATRLALAGWTDKENPMPNWRRRIMWVTRLCARCILFSFGYQWIRKRGKPAPREIAPIVVSNHVSYIEPIFYFYELFPTIVASESHDSIPLVGTIIRAMQVIYVDRFSQASRKLAVNEIKRKASCDIFPRLLLFPEGTTTNGNVLISFQLGAFLPGYPIQPVVVRYPHVHFDQSWGNVSLLKLMFRMFTQFHNFMELEYLPVVFPSDSQKENAVRLAEGTSHAIATALNVVQTSHSYGDLMLINKASELKLENPSRYMVEMARIKSLFDISTSEAVEFLYAFVSMNPDHSGCVKLHGFLKGMKIKNCRLSELIFEFIDAEKMGCITFKQFLYASAHVKKQPVFQQACELAFAECDAEGDGCMSEQQFGDAIKSAIPDMNKDEVRGVFDLFDVDKDQRISRHDFLHCLRKYPLLIALFGPSMASNDF